MSMFNDDSYNDGVNAGKRIAVGCIVASLAILGILLLTLSSNKKSGRREVNTNSTLPTVSADEPENNEKPEYVAGSNKRTSDELSFWNMYDSDDRDVVVSENKNDIRKEKDELLKKISEDAAAKEREEKDAENRFNIKNEGEEPEYVAISRSISLNELSDNGFSLDGNGRLTYSINGKPASHFGIDVSKNNGNIDWAKAREDGVEFAMLKLGSRGYSTGNIQMDDYFDMNVQGCSANGIDVGAYFFSQAVTREEAIEEANYCIVALAGKKLKYPVVFDSESIANDTYRTENLSASALTDCAIAFCETIAAYGYTPMIGGTKERLVKDMNPVMLQRYGVWLFDTDEKCDYPYRYAIRQYNNEGTVNGVESKVSLDICLISYSER
ncbi:MAG: glycoside hydrolase family 25 protein [Lachnospiraceae bacterium]|nr:glycoside hydrolase family 25 protein [Lachnospiraceae bacterium]